MFRFINPPPTARPSLWISCGFEVMRWSVFRIAWSRVVDTPYFQFTDLPEYSGVALAPGADNITVLPNSISPYARICPLSVHPSECKPTKMYDGFKFAHRVRWSDEDVITLDAESGEKKMEWGCWFELVDDLEDVRKSAAYLPFFVRRLSFLLSPFERLTSCFAG